MSVVKTIKYTGSGGDALRRFYTLADLQEFVAQIVADNNGATTESVHLRIDGGLHAELQTSLPFVEGEVQFV